MRWMCGTAIGTSLFLAAATISPPHNNIELDCSLGFVAALCALIAIALAILGR